MNAGRRDALEGLVSVWSSEIGAISYADIISALDGMLLTSVIDNRKQILKLMDELRTLRTKIDKIKKKLVLSIDILFFLSILSG